MLMSGDRTAFITCSGFPGESRDNGALDAARAASSIPVSSATVCVLGDTTILITSSDQTRPPNMWLRIASMSDDGKKIMICFSARLSCFRDGRSDPADAAVNILLHAMRAPNAWNNVVTSWRLSARSRNSSPCNQSTKPHHLPSAELFNQLHLHWMTMITTQSSTVLPRKLDGSTWQ